MGKGYLSHSPFQVESIQRKYAIEHDTTDCHFQITIPKCEFYVKSTKCCGFTLMGTKSCTHRTCPYYHKELRSENKCYDCVFWYNKICRHYLGGNCKDQSRASFCPHYSLLGKDVSLMKARNQYIVRDLKHQIALLQQGIQQNYKNIKQFNKRFQDEDAYRQEKVAHQYKTIEKKQTRIKHLREQINEILQATE